MCSCRPAYASRKQTNDEVDRDVELPYYELERLYSGTPAGRAMLNDLRKNQAGVPHPDPKAHGMHDKQTACITRITRACGQYKDNENYRLYKIFRERAFDSGDLNHAWHAW